MSCFHVGCLYDNSSDYTSACTQWVWLMIYMSHYRNMPTTIMIHLIIISLGIIMLSISTITVYLKATHA